ncbi:hypothetical protein NQ176_g394 [Zarea fungicola]|uniref:Uncharacterized protein n=1 Tax=Zarea fungicola TaxID=93591 RepID=A0ACC1NWW8_9HYPO|nr:hypothetical protein NQ176_g394 [Lecanicillium fungicola]
MASQADFKDRQFLAVIGDEVWLEHSSTLFQEVAKQVTPANMSQDSVTGLLLAGIGHVTTGGDGQKNFLVVDNKTDTQSIEAAFERFTEDRKDIGIVLINQHVRTFPKSIKEAGMLTMTEKIADRIRHRIDTYTAAFPTILEIPSKDHPYDPEKDSVLRRVRRLFGE